MPAIWSKDLESMASSLVRIADALEKISETIAPRIISEEDIDRIMNEFQEPKTVLLKGEK